MSQGINELGTNTFLKRFSIILKIAFTKMDTYICMVKSLHYSPETITTLLTGSTPIKKSFLVLKNIKIKEEKNGFSSSNYTVKVLIHSKHS